MDMREMTLKEYVGKASTGEPTPGGGSVAALVSSLGGALSNMVYHLTENKKAFKALPDETKDTFIKTHEEIELIREEIFKITQEDTEVFQGILDAMKLPKDTDDEKQKRNEAMEEAYKHALEVPLNLAELSLKILKKIPILAKDGDKFAVSDAGCGALFCYSALEAALFNVLININYINDEAYKKEKDQRRIEILKEGKTYRDDTLDIVYERIG